MKRIAPILLAAALLLAANAQTITVDPTGGPLTLAEDLGAAIASWQGVADPPLPLAIADDGDTPVRYASDLPLGPDTLALTLVRQGSELGPPIEIVVSPDRYTLSPATLLHEIGIVLGLTPSLSPTSVMRSTQSAESPAAPSNEDAEALARLRAAVPEDVNRDGRVDFEDLIALASSFGAQGLNLAADIDGSGRVDEADLEALRAAYTFGPPDRNPRPESAPDPGVAPAPLPEIPAPAPDGGLDSAPAPPDVPIEPSEEPTPPDEDGAEDDG